MGTLAATAARADFEAAPVARRPAANFVADPAVRYDVLRDGARIAALKDLGLLDTTAEEAFDRYTRLATNLLGIPVSLVTLVDADRAFFTAPLQLALPNLTDIVACALDDHGLPASAIVLEITEGVLISAGALQTRNLQLLRELGVRISLDDFGTGYSALAFLKRFAIDELKIDRSFITALESDRRDAAFVQAILALARGLGLQVVAEGIETVGQQQALKLLGCEYGQGRLFAPRTAAQLSGGRSGS
jgi:hypothetical protein